MTPSAKPPDRDPATPAFWDLRFRTGVTPWDSGRTPAALQAFAHRHAGGRRVLIPGCGSGWEAAFLAGLGWDVTALDFSAEAVARARALLGPLAHRVQQADFFAFEPATGFDVVYERTFLCAMPRARWPDYAARMGALVLPGGLLAGCFFFSAEPKGPPFGTTPEALAALLNPAFEREDDRAVDDSVPLLAGRERWQVWRRRDPQVGISRTLRDS